MLSILIPTYNYNISELLKILYQQASAENIQFEILAKDDASTKYLEENLAAANQLSYTKHLRSKENIGRTATRQFLSEAAKYDWLLFLDADVIPKKETFIADYITEINTGYETIFGGFSYDESTPNYSELLRWKYGKKYEEIDAGIRNKKPYEIVISANFLIKKSVFLSINPLLDRKSYGLDNYFSALLKKEQIKVFHINNEVFHYGLETNAKYVEKAEQAADTILWMYYDKQIRFHNNKLLKMHLSLKKLKLNYITSFFYSVFSKIFKKNLVGKNPNVKLLQLYKLFYISHKDINN